MLPQESGLPLFLKVLEYFRDYGISIFKLVLPSFKMAKGQDISMTESSKSKLDAIMNALTTLSQRTTNIEGAFAKMLNNGAFGIAQSTIHQSQASTAKEAIFPAI